MFTESSHAYCTCGSKMPKHPSKDECLDKICYCSKVHHSSSLKNLKGHKFTLKLPAYKEQLYNILLCSLSTPSNYSQVTLSFPNSLDCIISLKCKSDHNIPLLFHPVLYFGKFQTQKC